MGYLPGNNAVSYAVPVLQGGFDGGFDDVPPQVTAWNRAGSRLVPNTGQ